MQAPRGRVAGARTVISIVTSFYRYLLKAPISEIATGVIKGSLVVALSYAMSNWGLMFNLPEGSWLYNAADFIRQRLVDLQK